MLAGVSRYGYTVNPATSYGNATPVTFKIAGTTVGQSTWTDGANKEVNLSSGTPITPGTCGTCITDVQLGNATGYSNGVITIDQNRIKGAAGATGATGATGDTGPAGKGANNVLGIVGIVLAAIALIAVVVVMMRKPAAPPSQKT
jgi:hypothetical protein